MYTAIDMEGPRLSFLYVGRDWGYRQSPKKAVCTSDNLLVRLRATTDGYVLGKLMNVGPSRYGKSGRTRP
jgi:hypothetical protein